MKDSSMTPVGISTVVWWTAVALLTSFDLTMAWFFGQDATLSAVVVTAAEKHPIIPFLLGLLMGHLFFSYCHTTINVPLK